MADETLNKGPEGEKLPESPAPEGPGAPPAPEQAEQVTLPGMGEGGPAPSGKVINLSDVRGDDKGGKAPAVEAEKPEKRRGRPPKEQAEPKSPKAEKTAKPRTGRPPKGDKAARAEAQPSTRDKVSQSKKKTPEKGSGGMAPPKSPPKGKAGPVKAAAAPVPEINLPPTPAEPPRPVEEGKVVYLKLSELHAFHTFREHPYKVQDDKAMDDLVGTIKEHGVMTPATVRPEKDGQGYEIIAGHRRHHGSERAGLDEMPCIVRNMTDFEAVREMRNSNKQRGEPLPSELARLLDLEVEAIKHQGARPGNSQEEQAHSACMYYLTKSMDTTRMVISNDGWNHTKSDLLTVHDYTCNPEVLRERYGNLETLLSSMPTNRTLFAHGYGYEGQPVIVSEFGGVAYRLHKEEGWGYAAAESGEGFLKEYERLISALAASPLVQGFVYTQLCDVEQEMNGLLTYDREPKVPVEQIRNVNLKNFL